MTPPARHELEISVFGPGIGECIIVHLGDGDWIIIDSCKARNSSKPVALEYLESLGVDVATQVRLVVATHWHDDHIQGLAAILESAKTAKFVNSGAYQLAELARVVRLGALTAPSAATAEFNRIFETLQSRRKQGERLQAVGPVAAIANRKLLSLAGDDRILYSEVVALSPADSVFNIAHAELESALSTIKQKRRPAILGPNQLSVVLWINVGAVSLLLGADLEQVRGSTEGWNAICDSQERPDGRARFFKVPHHGSENADSADCWKNLLSAQPLAFVTPYTPSRLPAEKDIERMCSRTGTVFLTGRAEGYGLPRRENAVEKTIREMARMRRALVGRAGHIMLRCDARKAGQEPTIKLDNGAHSSCSRSQVQ